MNQVVTTRYQRPAHTSTDTGTHQYTACPLCHNVKFRGRWYASDSKVALLGKGQRESVRTAHCPACTMRSEGRYGALLKVNDVPEKLRSRVETVLDYEVRSAALLNPQHRLLEISETLDGYQLKVTSLAMARAISQALKTTFRAREMVTHLHDESKSEKESRTPVTVNTYL